jgi:hypothetical protein
MRLLFWLLGVEALMRRLDRRPSACPARIKPLNRAWLSHHIGPATSEPAPIEIPPFL